MTPGWFEDARSSARQAFEKAERPNLKYGLTISLDRRRIDVDSHTEDHSEQVVTMEHEGCEVHNLFDMLDDPRVKKHLFSTRRAAEDRFSLFHKAYFDLGLLIIVPKGSEATVDLSRTLTSGAVKEHTLIICEENATLTIIDKYQGDSLLRSAGVEVVCESNAHVRYASIQYLDDTAADIGSYRARLADGARMDWFIASLGGSLTKADVDTTLEGVGAKGRSYGVFLGTDDQQFDLSASTFHRGDRSESDMYTRGVLDGSSKGVYRGNIDIAAEAFGCNGYQKEETILLSGDAVADAIPNLEIRNNDVKCSHGATIGRVDDEQLFYLTSRGVPKQKAIRMIIEGFFEPLAHRLDWPQIYTIIRPLVQERIS